MELRQLTYFEAVARLHGFTRAAGQLRVAQSAVSAQIRALEAELGTALFTRTTRRVALTQAGELLLARTRRVFGELDGARADLAELAAVLHGRVTLGSMAVLGGFDLPAALAGFHARYPGVSLALRTGLIAELLAKLDAGEVDLVLGPVHEDLPARFTARELVDEQVVLILPPGRAAVRELADVRDEPFGCLPAGSGLRAILDRAAADAGFEPRVQFETHSAASIRELVSAGLGVALVARSAAVTDGPAVVVVRLEPAPAHPAIGLIHLRDRRLSAPARACRQELIRRA
jgi:LysR family transcriptional activator of glutamate synthase operon